MNSSNKAIGVFGGTFDPVHNGHLSIAESFLRSDFIDELWVFLSPTPPHKEQDSIAGYTQRLKMLQAAFKPFNRVVISDLESRLPKPSYTVQTLSYLVDTNPENSFYICVGEDSFNTFTSWYHWEEILDHARLLVANRPSAQSNKLPEKLYKRAYFIDHKAIAISSTQIRKRMLEGLPIDELVPQPVADIIVKENLYQNT